MKYFILLFLSFLFLTAKPQIPDTAYSNVVISDVLLDGIGLPGANISYTLLDTINDNTELIREAITDIYGQDVVDSLPVVKHITGIPPINNEKTYTGIVVTNNGIGSDHLIRFTSDAKEIGKEAYIVNLLGQQIKTIPVTYNSSSKTYDAVWHGQGIESGIYLFYAKSTKGPIAKKIKHEKNMPSNINYGAEVKTEKSSRAVEEEEGASKYIINIEHEGLESFIDTVLVKEDGYHQFIFNVNGTSYDEGNVTGWIEFSDLSGSPSDADVEYKRLLDQSTTFTTTAPDGFYQIDVPVVFEQANPGQTKYIITISPNGGDPFITQVDTMLVYPGANYFQHYVDTEGSNPNQDIEGIVRHVYTKATESGVTVRVINRSTGILIEEDVTGSDGKYHFADIPAGTEVEFELGKTGELWMVNNEYNIPVNVSDTLVEFNRYFYPKTVEVPKVGTNSTITGDGAEIAEIVGSDFVNFEEILRDIEYMWANGPGSTYWSARTWIEDNFYEGNSPITTTATERDITETMQNNYDPYTNFYAGQLGWNVNFGGGNTTTPIFVATDYGVGVIGGEIMTTGLLKEFIKELQGRRLVLGSVGSRTSFMNSNPAMPDSKDRAYVHLILINQNGRFDTDEETFSLEYITSVEPASRAARGIGLKDPSTGRAGIPLPGAKYQDVRGNKPHSKRHFNKEKYLEQRNFQHQEQGF